MQRHRFSILAITALCAAASCHRQSLSESIVGIWQFSSFDNTMDYVFKADHTFEVWAAPMDSELSKGPWWRMDFGSWQVQGDELIIEYKRPRSSEFKEFLKSKGIPFSSVSKSKVLRYGSDRIEFQKGGPFVRATSRRGI